MKAIVFKGVHDMGTETTKDPELKAGAVFVKTSTGWMPTGATLETVSLISNFVGNAIKIKAAGGIRDLNTLAKMVALGVARFGINVQASMDLISACAQLPGGVLKVSR